MINKKTKIVCTIGPASEAKETLKKMIRAGMNVARLNFSHGSYDQYRKIINNIRALEKEMNMPIAIMQDLQGPKIRVGKMPEEGITIKKNQTIVLSTSAKTGTGNIIPVQYKNLPNDVSKKDEILINDGLIELKVLNTSKTEIKCKVVTGGLVQSQKGINVPTSSISSHPITAKDKKDLLFGLEQNVDFVALSFVRNNKDIEDLRTLIRQKQGRAKIVAKIERHEAVKNLESIILEADAVMVARGDLGVEVSPEKVPLIQKRIIHLSNIHGKPVITATEMLQSMIENPRATRAEVSDTANAILDHTDAIMLSNETAVGKYPVKAVKTMSKISANIEKELKKNKQFIPNRLFTGTFPVSYATCASAARLANDINANLIITVTLSGFTAQHTAKHRIHIPIIAITEDLKVVHQLQLVWNIGKVFVKKINQINQTDQIRKLLIENSLVKPNDKIVIVTNASTKEKTISTLTI